MRNGTYVVKAIWDDEARVWVATSDDVPGLATEAESIDVLLTQRNSWIKPEHDDGSYVPLELIAEYHERLRLA
jgi:predicted RNase H-like HicB family nuclease